MGGLFVLAGGGRVVALRARNAPAPAAVIPVAPSGSKTWTAECTELVHRAAMNHVPLEPLAGWVLSTDPVRHHGREGGHQGQTESL